MLRCLSLSVVVVATIVCKLMQQMPHPYDAQTAVEIEPARLALLPGREHGPAFPPDLSGPFATNERLKAAKRLFVDIISGSESVAVSPSGELLMLDKFGFVHRARPTSGSGLDFELSKGPPLYIGPGRPLGYHSVENGSALLVCDSLKGLLRVELGTGSIEVLANRITESSEPLNYINDLDVAADGTVYFTSSTKGSVALNSAGFYDTMRSYLLNSFSGDATGQLLSWDPYSKEVKSLVRGIAFANGVAVSADGSFVAVVETNLCRVLRYWLRGPKKGTYDVLVDRLPGFPDGLSVSAAGGFWVPLVVPLSPLPGLLGPHRWLRQLLSHAVLHLVPYIAKTWGCVVRLDADGTPVETLMDPRGEVVSSVSAVTETSDGRLFLGNLQGSGVSVFRL